MTRRIIVDDEPLSKKYLPKRLAHREEEYEQLKLNVEKHINTLLLGPVGAGKTALANRVIKDLPTRDIRYVDCTLYDTEFSVLREVLPTSRLIPLRSIYELLKELAKVVKKKPVWICFDNFTRIREIEIIRKVMSLGVNVILIGNVESNAGVLNQNVLSNVPCLIKLPNYTLEQSLEILRDRAKESLAPASFTDDLLREIAARTKGNMTLALNVLRVSAARAESDGQEVIDLCHVPEIVHLNHNRAKSSQEN